MLFNLLSSVVDSGSSGDPTFMEKYGTWLMLGGLVIVLGIMMYTSYRSNKKRQKEAEDKLNNLRIGDRVKTIGGICGVIVEIDNEENTFVLETGLANSGNYVKFDKIAVYQSSHPEEEKPAEEAPAEDAPEAPAEAEAVEAPASEEVAENVEKAE